MQPTPDGEHRFGQISKGMHLQRDVAHMRKYPKVLMAYHALAAEFGDENLRGFAVGPNDRGMPEDVFLVSLDEPGYGTNGMRPVAAIHPSGEIQMLWKDNDKGEDRRV